MTKLSIAKSRLLLAIAVLTFICGFSSGLRASTDINIQISDLSSLEKDDKEQQIQLSLAGRDYIIKLWPSHIDDKLENLKGSHFKGSVIGDSQSWARLSYIDNHLTGYVKAFGELLEIDTLGGTADAKQIARKVDLSELKNRTSGLDRVLRAPPRPSDKPQALSVPPVTHREYKYKGVTRIMRLSIVVDSRFNRHYKGEGLEKAVSTINAVDGLFQDQFGLAVQLDSALLLTEANDPFLNYNGNIEQVLRAFRNYSLQHESLSDNQTAVHLFSGANDIDNIIGLSWIDTACRQDGYNASVSTLFSEQTLLAAHELAHNLGAVHDDDQSCTIEYNKIMWPNISAATNNRFSNCSKAAVIPKLNASCNLDNIDIGISLDLKQSIAFGTQAEILAVTAHNSHAYRDAPDIRSATLIQDGIQVSKLPDQCIHLADTIYCNHGNIRAADRSTVEFKISYSKTDTQIVTSEIDAPAISDVANLNDQATLDLNNPGKSSGYDDADTGNTFADTSGGGAGSLELLMTIFLLLTGMARLNHTAGVCKHAQFATKRDTT